MLNVQLCVVQALHYLKSTSRGLLGSLCKTVKTHHLVYYLITQHYLRRDNDYFPSVLE